MAAVQCPVCHLRFYARTELEWHGRNDHCRHELRVEQTSGRTAPKRARRAVPTQPSASPA